MNRTGIQCLVGCLFLNCGPSGPHGHEGAALEVYFTTSATFQLEESAGDSIGDIGTFLEAQNGDLLIADGIESRIRRYASDGRLLAQFGTFGEGPFEFRRVGGLAESASGQIVAFDPSLGRVTILTNQLGADTAFQVFPRPAGRAVSLGGALLVTTASGSRGRAFTLFNAHWRPVWSVPAPIPGSMSDYPYWGSYSSTLVATSSSTLITAYSFLYPIYTYDARGALQDSLRPAPRAFRTAPRLAPGAFSGPDATHRREEWLAAFDVIADLAVVNDTLLVVTHGVLRRTATARAAQEHHSVDVYDLRRRSRLAENVRLPPGSRVLAGGRSLFILTAQPPQPWTVVRANFRERLDPSVAGAK